MMMLSGVCCLLQCSFNVCRKNLALNTIEVDKFVAQWLDRENDTFPCFYDTEQPDRVIVSKRHSKIHVINSMVWPSLVIVICGVVFLHLETKRRGMPFCGEKITETSLRPHYFEKEGRNGKEAQNTLLETWPNSDFTKVHCRLTDSPGHKDMSHSLPSIDKIKPPQGGPKIIIEDENSYVTRSLSADGLHDWGPGGPGKGASDNTKAKLGFRQDSTKSADSAESQGSRVTGIETPV